MDERFHEVLKRKIYENEQEYQSGLLLIDEIAKMLWSTIDQLESKVFVS
jgi:hypothetical protein